MGKIQAWQDEANITGQTYAEKPFWYLNEETGQTYHDIFGCVGWPSEFSDKSEGAPGYVGVVGVVKMRGEGRDIKKAPFQLLAELESRDVQTMVEGILELRRDYGFGTSPGLMQTFWGDPDRFIAQLALINEGLTRIKGEKAAILVTPPLDFYEEKVFDSYVRSFRSVLVPDRVRFYFGKNEILKSRLGEFKGGDPAVFAVGGLVHTLLGGPIWMHHMRETMFVISDGI